MDKDKSPKRTRVLLPLRPSVQNPLLWRDEPLLDKAWPKLRLKVLDRDEHRCRWCGHKAMKYMSVHHLKSGKDHRLSNLATCCVACHSILHMGRGISLGYLEIWQSSISQLAIVRKFRKLVKQEYSLREIKASLNLTRGPLPCKSISYANTLIELNITEGNSKLPHFELPKPLCAIFVKLKRWQIDRQ